MLPISNKQIAGKMAGQKKAKSALISVFHKDNLGPIIEKLHEQEVVLYSTGGTQKFIEDLGIPVIPVESLTGYPSILGGRVKTLHPKVFGGILSRRDDAGHNKEVAEFEIPDLDIVIVDLYPFEETVASGAEESAIIEKIDIGGISLIRAAAKNYRDVMIVSSMEDYDEFYSVINENEGITTLEQRKKFAMKAFKVSSHYDTQIFKYFNQDFEELTYKESITSSEVLRYGENPHQKGVFYGNMSEIFDQLNGKAISYNNLLDIDAAVSLISEFEGITFAVLKHNNACGLATRSTVLEAWTDALAADSVSAFGGVLICNTEIDLVTAEEINKIFCEVVIAPSYNEEALALLSGKKNRIILKQKKTVLQDKMVRTVLNGVLEQDRDSVTDQISEMKTATNLAPTEAQLKDLAFASKLCKHTKSNAIIFAKGEQLLACGVGQTSRVDALRQAADKAKSFGFDLNGAVMASDAFFPFPDCVELADNEGIQAVIQPGGSIKDQLSIDYCNEHNMAMVFTGTRHFKH